MESDFFIVILLLIVYIVCLSGFMHAFKCSRKSEKGVRSPGVEHSTGVLGPNVNPMEEQYTILMADEPCLQFLPLPL